MRKLFSLLLLSIFTLGNTSAQVFIDIPEHSQYYDAAEYLYQEGVINGYSDTSFKPENTINRAEFTKIILGSEYSSSEILRDIPISNGNVSKNPFYDVDRFQWYAHLIWSAKNKGILGGYKDGSFKPNNKITKGEASKIIVNTLFPNIGIANSLESTAWWEKYTSYLEDIAVDNSLLEFLAIDFNANGNSPITRGEMIQTIYEIKKIQNPEISSISSGEVSRNTSSVISFNGDKLIVDIKNGWDYKQYNTGAVEITKGDGRNGKYILYIAPYGKITGRSASGSISDVMAGAAGYDLLNTEFPADCIESSGYFSFWNNPDLSGSQFYVSAENNNDYCSGPFSGNKWIGGTASTRDGYAGKENTSAGFKYHFNPKYNDDEFTPENLFSISMTYKPYGYTGEEKVYQNGEKRGVKKDARYWLDKFPEKNSGELNIKLTEMQSMINSITWK